MITGIGESRGWETIALPFDVQKISHSSKGELSPFENWKSGDSKKPFWLMSYGTGGWTNARSIKANTPYIISMPNNTDYKAEFRISGNITFSSENVTVKKSDNLQTGSYNGNTFIPNYVNVENSSYLALNVNNDYVSYTGGQAEGSTFVANLRSVHPFEAYMITLCYTPLFFGEVVIVFTASLLKFVYAFLSLFGCYVEIFCCALHTVFHIGRDEHVKLVWMVLEDKETRAAGNYARAEFSEALQNLAFRLENSFRSNLDTEFPGILGI